MAHEDPVLAKLAQARTGLILDKPFLGTLVLRLPLVEASPAWCRTTATDARQLYFNRRYIEGLRPDQLKFVLAHNALHCALLHFARRGNRERRRWDLACDLAVNPLLVAEGLKGPPDALNVPDFDGLTAEEIYPLLQGKTEQENMDDHAWDSPPEGEGTEGGGAPPPTPLTGPERDTLAVQWQQRLAGAAQTALQAGKLGGHMARLVDHLLSPQLPWRMLLARYLTNAARHDFSFQRPSRREGAAILPGLRSAHAELVVALDTSGSIADADLQSFVAEVNAIKSTIGARILLQACDAKLAEEGPWVFESWEEVRVPGQLPGGGATDFRPVFDWAARQDRAPDVLVYFTDARGTFPATEPGFPVLWLVKGGGAVPWGTRIQLN